MRRALILALIAVITLYVAAVAVLYLGQRHLLYHPNASETPPPAVGLPQAERLTLIAQDGERLLAWRIAPKAGQPMVVYFHGNGGGVDLRANRYRAVAAAGFGVLALEYRGYGGSTGTPSEAGLTLDAEAAYQTARGKRASRQDRAARRILGIGRRRGACRAP